MVSPLYSMRGMGSTQVLYNADDLEDVLAALSERAASAPQSSVVCSVVRNFETQ